MPGTSEPKSLKPIDLSRISEHHQNQWIALSRNLKHVYTSGKSSTEVLKKAKALGHPDAIITQLPPTNSCLIF